MNEDRNKNIGDLASLGESLGCNIEDINRYTNEHSTELNNKHVDVITAINTFTNEMGNRRRLTSLVEPIKIFAQVLSLGLNFPTISVTANVMQLMTYFIRKIFNTTDLEKLLDLRSNNDSNVHELSGLAEKLKRTEAFFHVVEVKENIDGSSIHSLVSNFDIHIGVDQIGNLKSRIASLVQGDDDDLQTCVHYLTLFVRISTIRQFLLFRMIITLKANNYSSNTVEALDKYLDQERASGKKYLQFFAEPSLEHVGILAVFDPSVQDELAAYLNGLHLPVQNLQKELDERIFLMQPFMNPSKLLGRKFPSTSSVRAMDALTDIDNVRIRFKFTAIKEEFNVFYIQSPDLGEYLLMQKGLYCKYSKKYHAKIGAKWRIIQVHATELAKKDGPSVFVLCTRKQPSKFLFIERSFFGYAKGRKCNNHADIDCLFKFIPPGQPALSVPWPIRVPVKATRSGAVLSDLEITVDERMHQDVYERRSGKQWTAPFPSFKVKE